MSELVINQEHRENIMALESALLKEEQVELEVKHYFAHGTYVRELFIPAGVVGTGKIHRYSHVNIFLQGKLKVLTDDGEHYIEAPFTFVSGPGVKKAAYAIEDTIWMTVHPWEGEEDLDLIEEALIVPSYEALEEEMRLRIGE